MLMNVMNRSNAEKPSKLLILHGSRQVGTLLVGRMDKLRKKLQKSFQMELIAPDAPFVHPDDPEMRQWWIREGDSYQGLEQSLDLIVSTWKEHSPEGILGFSQGARMAHLLVQCHESRNHPLHLQALRYVIMCAGYDAPLPTELQDSVKFSPSELLETPSLHIYGQLDRVIVPAMTQANLHYYRHAEIHTHEGGHHIPMRAANVQAYMEFIERHRSRIPTQVNGVIGPAFQQLHHQDEETTSPVSDEEAQMAQIEEVEALSAIFPDELRLLSKKATDGSYEFPIVYQIDLAASDEGVWPPHPLALRISYPSQYPAKKMAEIIFTHDNNMLEFSSHQMEACRQAMMEAAQAELGMPSVLTCVYAAREFFESGRLAENQITEEQQDELDKNDWVDTDEASSLIKPSSPERIQECNLQGLEIARTILNKPKTLVSATLSSSVNSHGGNWKYTCGLVGKPSAGKVCDFTAVSSSISHAPLIHQFRAHFSTQPLLLHASAMILRMQLVVPPWPHILSQPLVSLNMLYLQVKFCFFRTLICSDRPECRILSCSCSKGVVSRRGNK
jgi:predicted esterase